MFTGVSREIFLRKSAGGGWERGFFGREAGRRELGGEAWTGRAGGKAWTAGVWKGSARRGAWRGELAGCAGGGSLEAGGRFSRDGRSGRQFLPRDFPRENLPSVAEKGIGICKRLAITSTRAATEAAVPRKNLRAGQSGGDALAGFARESAWRRHAPGRSQIGRAHV